MSVAIKLAAFGRADVVEEAVEQGFSVKEFYRDVGGDIELPCSEEVEEYCETIWVPIDEVITIIISGILGLEVPILVEHFPEEGIMAGVGEGGGGGLEYFATNVEFY
ncbi:unnamed protein product [Camellia sinensis]